ncbi:MAG: glycine--tRNA ligase subunit beta [Woeseiaceae bacterium]
MTDQTTSDDCLIELGMEELPPNAIEPLSAALAAGIEASLRKLRLAFDGVDTYSAPRRLAVIVRNLADRQPDETRVMRGPPIKVAFDKEGKPTRAAEAFAKKAGIELDAAGREKSDKGEWITAEVFEAGETIGELLPAVLQEALDGLPIPRRMRWGNQNTGFVRPLHWLVVLHGEHVLPMTLFGIDSSRESVGHRFHSSGTVSVRNAGTYESQLLAEKVIVDVSERRKRVWASATEAAADAGCELQEDDALINEVTALCDWPVAVVGTFDSRFLTLPDEVLVSTLKVHQRYFPTYDGKGNIREFFVTIANIESKQPDEVKRGNERVVAPRLSDAAFFFDADRKKSLQQRQTGLAKVVYQKALGTIAEKVARVSTLGKKIAELLAVDSVVVQRGIELMRVDLLTDMVGEFPKLQGTMGAYYAQADGEEPAVVDAIRDQYLPRFAGDAIPGSTTAQIVAVADRLDTLAGIFAIGKRPTGNKDPFGLRRAALGLVRIIIEGELEIDLPALLAEAIAQQPVDTAKHPELAEDLYDFVLERYRNHAGQGVCENRPDLFDAVLARAPHSLVDFQKRLLAVREFVGGESAQTLAAVNKRIANILRNGGVDANAELDPSAAVLPAEIGLLQSLNDARAAVMPLVSAGNYGDALVQLTAIEKPVEAFFEDVMVMDDDVAVRRNRMALLAEVRGLFLQVADISELAVTTG